MTRIHLFIHAAVAALVAFGICGQQKLNAQDAAAPAGHGVFVGPLAPGTDDDVVSAPKLYQGMVIVGTDPPSSSPDAWPCAHGGSGCSSLPPNGLVIPFPYQLIPKKVTGMVVSTFQTTATSGTADVTVTITQGKTTVYTDSFNFPITAKGEYYTYVSGATLSGAMAGPETVTVTVTVGGVTITGKDHIHVQ